MCEILLCTYEMISFLLLLRERVKIFDPSAAYVCVRVPIQILRLLIHAIEQYVVKQLPPLNPNRNPKLVLCKLRTNCSVSWNNRSTIHPGNSIELASFFLHKSVLHRIFMLFPGKCRQTVADLRNVCIRRFLISDLLFQCREDAALLHVTCCM